MHRPGRRKQSTGDRLNWMPCPPQPRQTAWRRGAHLPAVVHSHEVTDQQEGVGQHAHCNLKPKETGVAVTPQPPFPTQGARAYCANTLHPGLPLAITRDSLPSPTRARREGERAAG